MQHIIKIKDCFYDRIKEGKKNWELRKNDRDYQVGDIIVFELFEQSYYTSTPQVICTSPEKYEITYILQGFEGLQDGFCILTIKKINN